MSLGMRRYRLLERLGEGGFGVVYRARLEGPPGFSKDVAVKWLHGGELPERVLARFRDEARILGLLRDRAIVTVEPPIRIDGRWALVMEYADGASCARLLRQGALPATVAIEVVGEVARALDVAFSQPGPDGEPLQLLHRDLKPANLQITTTGQVKILDFGVARARFDVREVKTTAHIAGTPAYMAPERLQGVEGPAADIYSLGVVLHELVVGVCPSPARGPVTVEMGERRPVDAVIELARRMRAMNPQARPTARQVEEQCTALRRTQGGPTLRSWAEEHVASASPPAEDPRIGEVLTGALVAVFRHITSRSSFWRHHRQRADARSAPNARAVPVRSGRPRAARRANRAHRRAGAAGRHRLGDDVGCHPGHSLRGARPQDAGRDRRSPGRARLRPPRAPDSLARPARDQGSDGVPLQCRGGQVDLRRGAQRHRQVGPGAPGGDGPGRALPGWDHLDQVRFLRGQDLPPVDQLRAAVQEVLRVFHGSSLMEAQLIGLAGMLGVSGNWTPPTAARAFFAVPPELVQSRLLRLGQSAIDLGQRIEGIAYPGAIHTDRGDFSIITTPLVPRDGHPPLAMYLLVPVAPLRDLLSGSGLDAALEFYRVTRGTNNPNYAALEALRG